MQQQSAYALSTGENRSASLLSAVGSHPKCFLAGTMFRCPSGVLVPIEGVQEGETLTSIGGRNVEVTEVILHSPENLKLVFLQMAGNRDNRHHLVRSQSSGAEEAKLQLELWRLQQQ